MADTVISELFDVREYEPQRVEGMIEREPLEQIEMASNPRRQINQEASTASPRCSRAPGSSSRRSAGAWAKRRSRSTPASGGCSPRTAAVPSQNAVSSAGSRRSTA